MGEIGETKGATGKGQQRLRRCTLRAQPSHLGTGRKIPQNSVIVRRRRSPSVLLCCFSSSLPAARARAAARCLGSGVRRTLSVVTSRFVVASPSRGSQAKFSFRHRFTLSTASETVKDLRSQTSAHPYAGSQSGSVSQSEKKNLIRGGGVSARAHSRLVPSCVALVRCVAFGRPKMSVWGHAGARSAPTKVACNPTYGTPALPPAPILFHTAWI